MLELNERCMRTFLIIICRMIFIHKIYCAGFVKTALVERIILRIITTRIKTCPEMPAKKNSVPKEIGHQHDFYMLSYDPCVKF